LNAVAAGAAAFVAVVGLVQLLGAWTLVLHRTRALSSLHARAAGLGPAGRRQRGVVALLMDVVFAAATTFCACATHATVHGLFHAGAAPRAARFLALAAALRCNAAVAIGVAVCTTSAARAPAVAAAVVVAIVAWAALAARALGDAPISPATVFVPRVSSSPPARAFADAWAKTAQTVRRYALHLAVPALAAGVAATSVLRIEATALPPSLWALAGAALGALVPVDLVAFLPLLILLAHRGLPVEFVAPFAVGVEVGCVRSRRVVDDYLTIDARRRWRSLASAVPFAVASALSLLAVL
jgi:hypothetical protein